MNLSTKLHVYRMCALILICAAVVGCSKKKDRELFGERYKIHDVALEGVERFKKRKFLEYLYIGDTLQIPLTETYYYSAAQVPADTERILALYRAYGYLEAEVLFFGIHRKRKNSVDLLVRVREGTPVTIDTVAVSWAEGADRRVSDLRPVVDARLRSLRGGVLEVPTAESLLDELVLSLKGRGFPFAEITADVAITKRRSAEVRFSVTPGPFARIGEVVIEGAVGAPVKSVRTEAEFAQGEPFSPLLLSEMEEKIFAMDLFSTVEISPGEVVKDEKIPIRILLTESKPQSIKVGVDLAVDASRWDQGVSVVYIHRNLFGKMWRLDARFRVGYAELPSPFRTKTHGPIARFTPTFTKKGLLEKKLVWTLSPAIELGIEDGYQYYTPSTLIGVSRLFGTLFRAELAHRFNFYDFFLVSDTLDANETLLGLDYRDPYLLSYLELKTTFYLTDRILEPRNGAVIAFHYSVAGGPFGGHYDFHKLRPILKGYWQVSDRVQLAVRAETGFIFPYGDSPGAPFNLQFYLGGSESVRGWGRRRLAPKTTSCDETSEEKCRPIPIGGKTEVSANAEVRVRTVDKVYVAIFADMGDVQEGEAVFRPGEWNYTAGGGLRYDSPVGKLRLDVGVRLNDSPLSAGEPRYAIHFGIGEAF